MPNTRTGLSLAIALVIAASTNAWAADQDLPARAPPIDQQGMQCEPLRVRSGDTIHMSIAPEHGGYLAIESPTRERFYMVFPQPDPSSPAQPSIPWDIFRRMTDLSIKVGDAQGYPSKGNDTRKVPIFRQAGTYTVIVSNQLETDEPVLDGWCKINFRP